MSIVKENWQTVIHNSSAMRDVLNAFIDDYENMARFCEENDADNVDDATWVHVDVAKEEREELESNYNKEIDRLEKALSTRNEEYLELAEKYKGTDKIIHNYKCECRERDSEIKALNEYIRKLEAEIGSPGIKDETLYLDSTPKPTKILKKKPRKKVMKIQPQVPVFEITEDDIPF